MEEKRFDRAPETGRGASVRWRSRGLRSRKRTSDYPFRRRSCPRSTPSGFRPLTGATSGRASASSPRVFSGARADLPSRPSAALPARPSTPCPHRPCQRFNTLPIYLRVPFSGASGGRRRWPAAVSEGALPSQSPLKSVSPFPTDRPPRRAIGPLFPRLTRRRSNDDDETLPRTRHRDRGSIRDVAASGSRRLRARASRHLN